MTGVKRMRAGAVVTVLLVWKLFGQLENIFLINWLNIAWAALPGRRKPPPYTFAALRGGCE
jgi:hypothetical protein